MSKNILPSNGEVFYYPDFFSMEESDLYFQHLLNDVPWKQEPIVIFGKQIMQPRLTAFYGDLGKDYGYSGIRMASHFWTPELSEIKQKIEKVSGVAFSGALLNYYRDGNDSMGWHRDNEKELGKRRVIGSVSFGASRIFQFRAYATKKSLQSLRLAHGSFILMRGESQQCWEHRVPKEPKVNSGRVNITFRILK